MDVIMVTIVGQLPADRNTFEEVPMVRARIHKKSRTSWFYILER